MNTRQYRLLGVIALLVLLVLYYVSNGGSGGGGGGGGGVDLDSPEAKLAIENFKKANRALALQFDPAGEDGARADVYQQRLSSQAAAAAAEPTGDVFGGFPDAEEEEMNLPDAIQPAILPPANDVEQPIVDVEKSVAGRKKMKDENKQVVPQKPVGDEKEGAAAKIGNVGSPSLDKKGDGAGETDSATDEASKIDTELNDILKRSPIVIFSKTYCRFSMKAKHILQDLYAITPPPLVVELDRREDKGQALQAALKGKTGRGTVPNVMINGISIGGGDDVEALHTHGQLIETIKSAGGKQITSIVAKDPVDAPHQGHV